ncbi:MAG TPA: hypothetical protein VFC09_07085 [Candidatus Dormibacteraeota bacterium]|nr:hypothetical protein [Candidatus Dormibacteraeota bacterium]
MKSAAQSSASLKLLWQVKLDAEHRAAHGTRVGDDVPADPVPGGPGVLEEEERRGPDVALVAHLVALEPLPVVVGAKVAQEVEQRRGEAGGQAYFGCEVIRR